MAHAPADFVARPRVVTGTGAASTSVMNFNVRPDPPRTKKFILERISPDVSEWTVRGFVRDVVYNLYNFHQVPRRDNADSCKAYIIKVGADDEPYVMNPANWPVGLTVRPKAPN